MNLRNKMLLYISIPVIITMAALSFLAYYQASSAMNQEIRQTAKYTTAYYGSQLQNSLADKESLVNSLAVQLSNTMPVDAELFKMIQALNKNTPGLLDIYVAFPNKRFIDATGWIPPADYDPTVRPWYKQASEAQEAVYSAVYIDAITKKPVVSISKAVRSGSSVVAIVGVDLDLAPITEIAKNIKVAKTGTAFVLNKEGNYVYHPTLKLEQNILTLEGGKYAEFGKAFLSGNEVFREFSFGGVENFYAAVPVGKTGWSLVVRFPKTEVFESISALGKGSAMVSIVALVLIMVVVFFIARSIAKPVAEMAAAAQQVAAGDLTTCIDESKAGQDEVGKLARSFATMIANLRNMVKQTSNSAEQLAASSQEMTASASQSAEAANSVAIAITSVASGTERQVKAVDETTAAIGDISTTIQSVSSKAGDVAKMTKQTAEAGQAGRQALERVTGQMNAISTSSASVAKAVNELASSSKQIVEIVGLISGIAGQTNLLALNAAIEAARAGEQGRGFAVVAEEVRKLAEQSEEAAKQITQLISRNVKDIDDAVKAMALGEENVQSGTRLMQDAGQSFNTIAGLIDQVSVHVGEMNDSISDVAKLSQLIVQSSNEIESISKDSALQTQNVSAATEEQSASMQEIASASQTLAKLAQELQTLVSRFRV